MLGISPKNAGILPKEEKRACRMSGSTLSDQFQNAISAEVEARRARGLKAAFSEVARLFGLTERRVRACWHHEIRRVSADEFEAVRTRRRALLVQRHEQLEREMAVLAATLDAEGLTQ